MRLALACLLVLVTGCTQTPTAPADGDPERVDAFMAAAVTSTSTARVAFPFLSDVPCAADGAGETLAGTGTLLITSHTTTSNGGTFRTRFMFNPQGVKLTGQTTGDVYQGTGVSMESSNAGPGSSTTVVNNFRLIGPGPGNNYTVHTNMRMSFDAGGELTAELLNTRIDCR